MALASSQDNRGAVNRTRRRGPCHLEITTSCAVDTRRAKWKCLELTAGDVKSKSRRAVVQSCGRAFGRAGFHENLVSAPVKRVVG